MFGKILRELRIENNLSQEELSKIIGVSKSTIGMYELDKRMPQKDNVLKKIATYFSVSIDYLLGFENINNSVNKSSIKQRVLTFDEEQLLKCYNKLNTSGREKASEYVADLTTMKKYIDADVKSKLG